MNYFPLFAKLANQPVLVIGGGEVAARKVALLARADANIHILSPQLCPELQAMVVAHHDARTWQAAKNDLKLAQFCLIIVATDDRTVNAEAAESAKRAGVWCNVVDDPAQSSFITPAIIDRNPLIIALSSSGSAPVLARRLKAKLETLIPANYGQLAKFAAHYRAEIMAKVPKSQRLRFWEKLFDGEIAEYALSGNANKAEQTLQHWLQKIAENAPIMNAGEVYLVGGGPGDPDLLTFRALRLMQQADVVLYDQLVSPAVMALVRQDAERIDVGKRRARHTLPQPEINQLLVKLAREGKRVLRLKGGDPFIFGRGGEEIAELAAQGIAFQVVPGISAANGAASYAGIPLTHRDYAQSCIFVTGHLQHTANGEQALTLNWQMLAQKNQTVVFYMGLTALNLICTSLQKYGLPENYPIALVEQATLPQQKVVVGTLRDLPEKVKHANIQQQSLLIVGEVVRLRDQLNWFNH